MFPCHPLRISSSFFLFVKDPSRIYHVSRFPRSVTRRTCTNRPCRCLCRLRGRSPPVIVTGVYLQASEQIFRPRVITVTIRRNFCILRLAAQTTRISSVSFATPLYACVTHLHKVGVLAIAGHNKPVDFVFDSNLSASQQARQHKVVWQQSRKFRFSQRKRLGVPWREAVEEGGRNGARRRIHLKLMEGNAWCSTKAPIGLFVAWTVLF